MYRNNDNWINAYDYIKNQLMVRDYSNSIDLNFLKMKLWVLDGPPMDDDIEDGYIDMDVSNPGNHWASLNNELIFFDRYVRTEDDVLEDNEQTFGQLKASRLAGQASWISLGNKDYEQSYSSRPTLITDEQFSELYVLYKQKENNGELTSVFQLIEKPIDDYTIDQYKDSQEYLIDNYKTPAQMEAELIERAEAERKKNDDNYVLEMNRARDEMWEIILSNKPTIVEPPDMIEDPLSPGDYITNPNGWGSYSLVVVNFVSERLYVGLTPGDSSHRGIIANDGGYKFQDYDEYGNGGVSYDPLISNLVSGHKVGELEWSPDDWKWCIYYTENDGDVYLDEAGSDLSTLPSGTANLGDLTKERFEELSGRWKNLNRLREDKIQNIGTRSIIESMVNANIPDLLPDYIDHWNDLKSHKQYYTKTLRDLCEEFE